MLKSVVATITRFKQNDDKTIREADEGVTISSVEGRTEYCWINTSAGDHLLVKGIDLVEAVQRTCNGEK